MYVVGAIVVPYMSQNRLTDEKKPFSYLSIIKAYFF